MLLPICRVGGVSARWEEEPSHDPGVHLHSTIGDVDHEVLDVAAAAAYLGLSERTFGELVLDDQIPHGHDSRRRTFTRPQLDQYLASARIHPGDIAHLAGPKRQGRYRGR
ncbi:MAG: helix-turn-helix domain-containing protein [Acidimicrobiales bacterium]